MYETAHPNSVNNPWADVWNIIKKGYIFFVTDIEKEIAEYLPHKVTTNGNIVLILASPHHEIMHKTIDNSFNIQFLLFKFLQEKGFGKENAQPMAAILEALNIVQDATFDKAVKHLKMNKLIQIDAQQGLFIPKDEDIKAAEEDAKLEREYNYHIQKAQEIANIRERNYIHNTQHNSNFQNV